MANAKKKTHNSVLALEKSNEFKGFSISASSQFINTKQPWLIEEI